MKNLSLKFIVITMIATFIVGCGKEDSSSTSSSAFVVKGSSSQMAKLHALVPSGSPTSF